MEAKKKEEIKEWRHGGRVEERERERGWDKIKSQVW